MNMKIMILRVYFAVKHIEFWLYFKLLYFVVKNIEFSCIFIFGREGH